MRNIFKGSLKGYVCEDCREEISEVEILIYHPYKRTNTAAQAATNEKDDFRFVSKDEIKQRAELLVYKAKTDAKGNFAIEIDERYLDASFDVDFVCGSVPPKHPKPKKNEIVQLHIATISIREELAKQAKDQNYRWEYAIAYKWWCYIRGHFFDAWTICGHLMNCRTNTPIANAKVTAMDADFLTDDNLGTATTDSNGHFRIDYTSADFKKTFLSPWINVETDPNFLSFQSGPDVYFKAELAGTQLIDETKANARKNVGYCLCVNLCSDVNVVNPDDPNFPSAWTGIGNAFSSSYGSSSYDFDADGYAGSGKHVIYSIIRLTGQAALKSASGNPIEYRFRISDTTAPNNTASLAESNFTKIVGVTPGLFYPSIVSKLTRKVYSFILNDIFVYSDQSDFDAEGWFDVNHAIERTLTAVGLTPADLALYNIIEEDTLISLNTTALTTAPNVPGGIKAGQNIPAANKIGLEKFAIRFEIREVINKAANIFGVIGGNGKTLNSVIMNNNPIYRQLSFKELDETSLCSPISGTIHARYTVYHPYLSGCSLHLNNNSHSVERDISDGVINTLPAVDERTNNSSQLNNPPADMTRCTYTLKLYSSTRKHNGDYGDSDGGTPLEQIFFYEA
ncbi:hypothetical protein J0383_06160 [Flavobacterium endoglycinae]|uniref:Carboxypeptidase regulatory-like domain-containing protein n=1 Tax=Flavobacterium endoglycinae TaxID=2816357 RepID=A0ABX7QH49_9FLAO|nr:hypothetical protein [Flavobacterium endoglycinae]QSW90394.1 hypothetical protein J0383_06160 [Flavobacterium endoglycinae]